MAMFFPANPCSIHSKQWIHWIWVSLSFTSLTVLCTITCWKYQRRLMSRSLWYLL